MTIKELKRLMRRAGRKGDIYLKFGDNLINADIENCGFQVDRDGNITLIIGADVADVEAIMGKCGKKDDLKP